MSPRGTCSICPLLRDRGRETDRQTDRESRPSERKKRNGLDEMNVLLLAAGYGTRLERDMIADPTHKYSHLVGLPKALLPLAGKPRASYWLDRLPFLSMTTTS
jgi:hypothetical protein